MRILSWVQTKINGRQDKRNRSEASQARHHAAQDTCKEEFSDWPQGLLAIGTFGNNEFKKQSHTNEDFQNSHSLQDFPEFTLEEVNKLEKELIELLSAKRKCKAPESKTGMGCNSNLSSEKFLDCPSSWEANQLICQKFCDELESGEDGGMSPKNRIILNKAKDLLTDKRNEAIGRKSFSFLLKKLLLCRRDFAPAPSLRDPVSESRMEKFLKAVLHKKIYPQNSAATTVKKHLEKKQIDKAEIRDKILMMMQDKTERKGGEGCKWVKTDSEYIVLEM